jgi:hypothetical protein
MQAVLCLSRPPTFRLSICRKADGCDRQQRVVSGASFEAIGESIRARRYAPEIESVACARRGSKARSATQGTDDSVFGVVELQIVPGVCEFRCAGRCGPGRRESLGLVGEAREFGS